MEEKTVLIVLSSFSAFAVMFSLYVRYNTSQRELRFSSPDCIKSFTMVNSNMLYFNRIEKTGSENFAFLLRELSALNGFQTQRYRSPHIPRKINFDEQVSEKELFLLEGLRIKNCYIISGFTCKKGWAIWTAFGLWQTCSLDWLWKVWESQSDLLFDGSWSCEVTCISILLLPSQCLQKTKGCKF